VGLVKSNVKSGSRGFIQNLFSKFWTFLQVSTNFGSLNYFLLFKILGKHLNPRQSAGPVIGPRLQPTGCGGLPCAAGRQTGWAVAWRPGPAEEAAHDAETGPRWAWSPGVVHTRDGTARWRAHRRFGGG
jgi:hypothetical protein